MLDELKMLIDDLAGYVKSAVQPLSDRIKALEDRGPIKGADGKDGVDGKSVTVDDVRPLIEDQVRAAIASLPAPEDGKDGKEGAPGKDGLDGKDGRDGVDGKDAEPVSEAAIADAVAAKFERRFSDMALSWERQARDEFQRAIDRMPAPKDGRDGKDAAPIESLEITQTERSVTIKLGSVERTIKLDTILDRGVWEQKQYEKGDAVTYGGSLWIAQQDTTDAPGASKAWRLAVKKGRDGRDLRDSASLHDKDEGVKV
ncbi:MAG: hypothetical protein KUL86_10715 [Castellaniella sp.]|nr:hypothetical protein [Castellaniella sp.]